MTTVGESSSKGKKKQGTEGEGVEETKNGLIMMTVQEALSTMKLDMDLLTYLTSNRDMWAMFGKMNSHLYRARLMRMMTEANLDGTSRFMVFFLFGVVKNKDRILKSMEEMTETDKSRSWYNPVREFITARVTQYVSDVSRSRKFPAVNIPNCNPGLDLLVYLLITPVNERSYYEAAKRPTFSQLNLGDVLQDMARDGNQEFWDMIVRESKNPDAVPMKLPPPEFREAYYLNAAQDKYLLVGSDLKEVPPQSLKDGYTMFEMYEYFCSVDLKQEFNQDIAVFHSEWNPEGMDDE
jgi:hypothetical protein